MKGQRRTHSRLRESVTSMGRCPSLTSEGLLHAHRGTVTGARGDGVTPRTLRRLGVPPRPGSGVDRELGTAVWGALGLA